MGAHAPAGGNIHTTSYLKQNYPTAATPLPWDKKEVAARSEPKPFDAAADRKRFEELAARGI